MTRTQARAKKKQPRPIPSPPPGYRDFTHLVRGDDRYRLLGERRIFVSDVAMETIFDPEESRDLWSILSRGRSGDVEQAVRTALRLFDESSRLGNVWFTATLRNRRENPGYRFVVLYAVRNRKAIWIQTRDDRLEEPLAPPFPLNTVEKRRRRKFSRWTDWW